MKHFKMKATFLITLLMGSAFSASAEMENKPLNTMLLVQRCEAADLTIDNDTTTKTVSTDCLWKSTKTDPNGKVVPEDSDMQISMNIANDVSSVGVHCIFTPSTLDTNNRDVIADVAVSKAARESGSSQPIQLPSGSWLSYVINDAGQTEVMAMVTNYINPLETNSKHQQANIIFDLNRKRTFIDRMLRHPFSSVPFNEKDFISCTFAPNVIPAIDKRT